jgi:hypothetical protein
MPIIALLLLITPGQGLTGPMPRPGSSPSKTAISVFMGRGSYNMGDINNLIDGINEARGRDFIDHFTRGTEMGFRVTQILRPNLSVAMAFGIHSTRTEYSGPYYPMFIDASGHCPTVSGFGVGEYRFADDFWLSLETGFRHANVRSAEWPEGNRFEYVDGSDISLSYTGFFVRVSIRTFIKIGF